jgi:hypothetical protein
MHCMLFIIMHFTCYNDIRVNPKLLSLRHIHCKSLEFLEVEIRRDRISWRPDFVEAKIYGGLIFGELKICGDQIPWSQHLRRSNFVEDVKIKVGDKQLRI